MTSFFRKVSSSYLVEADFKTVKQKFLSQNVPGEEIDVVLKDFKELRDKQRIKDADAKNIDTWGKKPFVDLKEFVSKLKGEKSKTQQKSETKSEGAELIKENDYWRLYRITDHKACMLYGKGTKWCITEKDGRHWKNYNRKNDFYFFVSKKRKPTDRWFKIALNIDRNGKKQMWDAKDNAVDSEDLPKNLKLPEFEPQPKAPRSRDEPIDIAALVEQLNAFAEDEEGYRTNPEQNDDYNHYVHENLDWNHLNRVDDEVEAKIEFLKKRDKKWEDKILSICDLEWVDGHYYENNELASMSVGEIEMHFDGTDLEDDLEALTDEEFKQVRKDVNFYMSESNRMVGHMQIDGHFALILDEKKLDKLLAPYLKKQLASDVAKLRKIMKKDNLKVSDLEADIMGDGIVLKKNRHGRPIFETDVKDENYYKSLLREAKKTKIA